MDAVDQGQRAGLLSITYLSSAIKQLTRAELLSIVSCAQPRNAARGITGILLYSGGNILQTIEGPQSAVEGLFSSIAAYRRHRDVTVVLRTPVSARTFPKWTMGFRDVLACREVGHVDGHSPNDSGRGSDIAAPADGAGFVGQVDGLSTFFQETASDPSSAAGAEAADPVCLLVEIFRRSTR